MDEPHFSYTHTIPANYKGDIELAFTLNGTNIKGSPVIIKVAPPASTPSSLIAGRLRVARRDPLRLQEVRLQSDRAPRRAHCERLLS